jgi:hypothetical protein
MKVIYTLAASILIAIEAIGQTPPDFQNALNNIAGTATNDIKNIIGDGSGNFYFCGKHDHELNFKGTKLPAGKGGAFFGKASSSGNILWLNQGGCENSLGDGAIDLAVDKKGDVYFCGTLTGFSPASFNGVKLPSAFGGFVAKYSSSGEFIWAHGYGSPIYAIAVDNNNTPVIHWESQIYKLNPANGDIDYTTYGMISGNLMNPIYHNIKIDAANNIIVQAGNKIIKFDPNFNILWSTPVTASLAETYRISLDKSGNVYATYYALFGTVTVGTISKSNFPNGYMYKLDANTGTPVFVDIIQINGFASKIKHVIIDNSENYYLVGDGAFNAPYISKLDKARVTLWNKAFPAKTKVNGFALLGDDCLAFGGTHSATSDFGSFSLKMPEGSMNIDNSFVASLCSKTTGTEEFGSQTAKIKVMPNPSNGVFTFDTNFEQAEIEIYNLQGIRIYQSKNNSRQSKIDLSNQPVGTYIYRVGSENKTPLTGKLTIE